jgi:deoxyribodipyrimidine photo-lyase
VHGLRAQPEVKAAKEAIVDKHGSRTFRDGRSRSIARAHQAASRPSAAEASLQLDLGF